VIVMVLAGIGLSVASAAKAKATHSACASNLKQLGTAIHLYALDNDGYVPPATTEETFYLFKGAPPDEVRASPAALVQALASYTKDSKSIWHCPTDPLKGTDKLWMGQRHLASGYRFLPFDPTQFGYMSWPPRMRLLRDSVAAPGDDVPLISDAAGYHILNPELPKSDHAVTTHSDGLVNLIRHDLSLTRMTADRFNGLR
jgi:hypothetical protein